MAALQLHACFAGIQSAGVAGAATCLEALTPRRECLEGASASTTTCLGALIQRKQGPEAAGATSPHNQGPEVVANRPAESGDSPSAPSTSGALPCKQPAEDVAVRKQAQEPRSAAEVDDSTTASLSSVPPRTNYFDEAMSRAQRDSDGLRSLPFSTESPSRFGYLASLSAERPSQQLSLKQRLQNADSLLAKAGSRAAAFCSEFESVHQGSDSFADTQPRNAEDSNVFDVQPLSRSRLQPSRFGLGERLRASPDLPAPDWRSSPWTPTRSIDSPASAPSLRTPLSPFSRSSPSLHSTTPTYEADDVQSLRRKLAAQREARRKTEAQTTAAQEERDQYLAQLKKADERRAQMQLRMSKLEKEWEGLREQLATESLKKERLEEEVADLQLQFALSPQSSRGSLAARMSESQRSSLQQPVAHVAPLLPEALAAWDELDNSDVQRESSNAASSIAGASSTGGTGGRASSPVVATPPDQAVMELTSGRSTQSSIEEFSKQINDEKQAILKALASPRSRHVAAAMHRAVAQT